MEHGESDGGKVEPNIKDKKGMEIKRKTEREGRAGNRDIN